MNIPFNHLPGQQTRLASYVSKTLMLGADLGFSFFAFMVALLVTDNFEMTRLGIFLIGLAPAVLLLLRGIAFYFFRTYLIIVRYVGIRDMRNVFLAVTTSSLAFGLAVLAFPSLLPKQSALAIILVDYLVLIVLCGGFRGALRLAADNMRAQANGQSRINLAIFGAGEMGALLQQVLKQNIGHDYRLVAFFDDNPEVHRKQLSGVPIFNPGQNFAEVVQKYDIKVAIMAVGQLPESRRVAFIDQCLSHKVKVKKVPPAESWINNDLQVSQLRDIHFEDLLNRPEIDLDEAGIRSTITGKTVLVTGCAGSIGSEIVKQCLRFEPKLLIGIDTAETAVNCLNLAFPEQVASGQLCTLIADVRDEHRLERIFDAYRPNYVFHAAAYKHVPIMESFPEEAIKTNVLGTMNTANLASDYGAEKFVMISTDKAVNPSNVMGASKRIAEIYVQSLNHWPGNGTQFITTRFGNVLGSNGSVIPLFRGQIERRQPVTVTHPDITRFFMTIPEACQLVLEAGAIGRGGEIFVFDMGEPVRIADLAKKMIQMAGLTPGQDIEIIYSGLRPGEKLYEELLDKGEDNKPTHHPKIKKAAVRQCDHQSIKLPILQLIGEAQAGAPAEEIVRRMKELVPEFTSMNSVFALLDRRGARRGA